MIGNLRLEVRWILVVGKSSFILSEIAQEVVGIDFSKSFIGAAQSILQKENVLPIS